MFENVSQKIKMLAMISTIIGIIFSAILGITLLMQDYLLGGLIAFIIGSICSWISSFITYAIGQTLENTEKLLYYTDSLLSETNMLLSKTNTISIMQGNTIKKIKDNTALVASISPTQEMNAATTSPPKANTAPLSSTAPKTANSNQQAQQQLYLFALQMIERRSYDIAYNTLNKIKGYKNVDELLQQLENRNQ